MSSEFEAVLMYELDFANDSAQQHTTKIKITTERRLQRIFFCKYKLLSQYICNYSDIKNLAINFLIIKI